MGYFGNGAKALLGCLGQHSVDYGRYLFQIALVIGIVLMAYWLGSLLHRTLSNDFSDESESPSRTSRSRRQAGGLPDYYEGDTGSDSLPMEVKIERPPHTLSDRDRRTYRILSASDGHPEPADVYDADRDVEAAPPVLNVVWEPKEGAVAQQGETKTARGPLQLVSSTPMNVKKYDPARGCMIEEPIVVNLFVESQEGGEGAGVGTAQPMSDTGPVHPGHNETTPSITLTETTTKTTVTSGFSASDVLEK
ncbi:hypothetical protein COOONC_14834 [Cooperia oncophora]